jgi:hypothetical protein
LLLNIATRAETGDVNPICQDKDLELVAPMRNLGEGKWFALPIEYS